MENALFDTAFALASSELTISHFVYLSDVKKAVDLHSAYISHSGNNTFDELSVEFSESANQSNM